MDGYEKILNNETRHKVRIFCEGSYPLDERFKEVFGLVMGNPYLSTRIRLSYVKMIRKALKEYLVKRLGDNFKEKDTEVKTKITELSKKIMSPKEKKQAEKKLKEAWDRYLYIRDLHDAAISGFNGKDHAKLEKQIQKALEGKSFKIKPSRASMEKTFYDFLHYFPNVIKYKKYRKFIKDCDKKSVKGFEARLEAVDEKGERKIKLVEPYIGQVLSSETLKRVSNEYDQIKEANKFAQEEHERSKPKLEHYKSVQGCLEAFIKCEQVVKEIMASIAQENVGGKKDNSGKDKLADKEKQFKGKKPEEVYRQRKEQWRKTISERL